MDYAIARRPGIGTTARIIQSQHLRFSRVTVSDPVLIVVKYGKKELRAPGFQCILEAGQAVAIGPDQQLDIINTPGSNGQYQADWLVWDPGLISDYVPRNPGSKTIDVARGLGSLPEECFKSIDIALDALRYQTDVPDPVAAHRLSEVLVWIDLLGSRFELREPASTGAVVRRLVASSLDIDWTASAVAKKMAMSEATLRRRLADEGTKLGELISDVRMSSAMQLLQSTKLPISHIALDVGYESASRFAVRFRRRFGFAPSAIRGHSRNGDDRS